MSGDWLHVRRGEAPLIVSIPHAGTMLPEPFDAGFISADRARKDADWHVGRLYAFAEELGATIVRTDVSRSIIDVNRDPSGVSLYPGQATTGLCPVITFDDEPLYREGQEPMEDEIGARRQAYFDPYHQALGREIERLRAGHERIVLYDAHSIRSVVPMLFEGELPELNIGTNNGTTCSPDLQGAVEAVCGRSGRRFVSNGRFRGGWITRHYGQPQDGAHAIQMESAMRFYLDEAGAEEWPPRWDAGVAEPPQVLLRQILEACIGFAQERA